MLLHARDYAPGEYVLLHAIGSEQVRQPRAVIRERRGDVIDRVSGQPVVWKVRRGVDEDVSRCRGEQRCLRQRHAARLYGLQRASRSDPEADDDEAKHQNQADRKTARRQRAQRVRGRHRQAERMEHYEQPAEQQQPAADGLGHE